MIEKVTDIKALTLFVKRYFNGYTVGNDRYEKLLCYKDCGKIVGFSSYSVIYDRAELNYIVIDDMYRRKSIGQQLLNYVLNDLKNNMVEKFTLEVNVNNKTAINFYLKNKFEIKATRCNYYKNGDAYLMVREVK